MPNDTLSIVVPAFREYASLPLLAERIAAVLGAESVPYEIVIVDDGSDDGTFQQVARLHALDPRVKGVRLSRQFGKEAAIFAGLRHTSGDAVVTMDADLQHPPELLPDLLRCWWQGAKIVHGEHARHQRGEGLIRGMGSKLFGRFFSRLTGINMERASDFKLLDREVADIIARDLPETRRFYRGLSQWVGFPQASVPFRAGERVAGVGKWGFFALAKYAAGNVTAFTSLPLLALPMMGALMLVVAAALGTEALISRLQGNAVSGFATLEITLLFVGSCTMIGMGLLGQYLAHIYDEIKGRPVYLVQERVGL